MDIAILSKLCLPISGKNLKAIYPEYLNLIFPHNVSDTPGIALDKIKNKYNKVPSVNGNNIPAITGIRNSLYNITNNRKYINAFAIVASHTHWLDRKPVIYKFFNKKNEYIIGPHRIKQHTTYLPVSFVFNKACPLAYEWFETQISNLNEFQIAYDIIHKLNTKLATENYPLGISIDFRFKNSLFEEPTPSMELPIDDPEHNYYNFSKIITTQSFEANKLDEETEQVAWHPFSDLLLNLNSDELEILNNLRQVVASNGNELTLEKIMHIIGPDK